MEQADRLTFAIFALFCDFLRIFGLRAWGIVALQCHPEDKQTVLTIKTVIFMAQPFYARKTVLKIGPRMGETVYSAQAYYYGTLSTKQVAQQIAQESALTQADVIGVIERLAYYCQTHMNLGYKVRLDGMGVFFNEFITTKTVNSPEEVTTKLIKCVRPAFSPEYTILNSTFRYELLPERVELTKVDFNSSATTNSEPTTEPTEPEPTEPENPDVV